MRSARSALDPIDLLVMPRIIALLVMLPLLTFIAMIAGVLGGASVGAFNLDIPPQAWLSRMSATIELRHFLVGLSKGTDLRADHRPDRVPGRPAGERHRAIGGRAHHLQRRAVHFARDHPRRDHGPVVHEHGRLR
jgi:hypothetical protein